MAFGAFLGHLQTEARNRGRADFPSAILEKTLDPIAFPLARGMVGMSDFFSGIFRSRSLVIQNQALKAQMVALDAYDDRVNYLSQEIAQLRAELNLPPRNRQAVNLDVIGVSQVNGTLTLDGGSERGIRPDLAVVNGDGLVGIVQSVSQGQSIVSLVTSYGVKLGGVDSSRQPPEEGLVSGLGEPNLTMLMFTSKASVTLGDLIVTSGQSENIPGGIVLGRVISVIDDPDYGTRRLTIDPAVNVGLMHEVQVLK